MSDKDTKQPEVRQIKADFLAGSINFVEAIYDLRKAGYTPSEAQYIVYYLIKGKYNGPRDK